MSVPDEANLHLGRALGGRFDVQEFCREGGFSLVFFGTDRTSGRAVAIKILKLGASSSAVLEFENDAALLRLLRKASRVVTLLEDGEDSLRLSRVPVGAVVDVPVHYLVLERADASLDELVVYRDKLSLGRRLEVFRDVVLGVHQMHIAGIVHRDIKAENCLVFQRPKQAVVKLTDLGRSKRLSEPTRFLVEDYVVGRGDLRFAPPEALWGQVGPDEVSMRRADLYLLGSVLYELVLGQAITAVAIGAGLAMSVANWAMSVHPVDRTAEYRDKIAEVAGRYELAFGLFEDKVPAVVEGLNRLLRQLCSPDPALREFRGRSGRPDADLGWALRRTDILIKRLHHAEAQAKALAVKKRRRRGQ
jgi:serine/threonine protein kinase